MGTTSLAVRLPAVTEVPTTAILSPTLRSANLAFLAYLVSETILTVQISLAAFSIVTEAVPVSLMRPERTKRLSATGLEMTNRRLTANVPWLSTSPMAMTKSPTFRSAKVPSLPAISLMVASPATTAVRV